MREIDRLAFVADLDGSDSLTTLRVWSPALARIEALRSRAYELTRLLVTSGFDIESSGKR